MSTYQPCTQCGETLRVDPVRPGQLVKRIHPSTETEDCQSENR